MYPGSATGALTHTPGSPPQRSALGHTTVTRTHVAATFEADAGWLANQHVQEQWERHQDESAVRIVEMNDLIRQMIDASLRSAVTADRNGAVTAPPDAARRRNSTTLQIA
jgi:hypothetical protein